MARILVKIILRVTANLFLFSLLVGGGLVGLNVYLDLGLVEKFSAEGQLDESGTPSDAFVVSVEKGDGARNVTSVVQDAIAYWNANAGRYPAAYERAFVFKENASNPDVLVRYRSSVSCSGAAPGCAPQPSSETEATQLSKPLVLKVSASRNENRLMTRRTLIHEFGHLLSIDHCEQPRDRMGCPESTEPIGTAWTERRYPFNTTELRVYVDTADASDSMRAAVDRLLEETDAGELAGAPSNVTVRRVADPWDAHLTVRVTECSNCRGEASTRALGGPPYNPGRQSYFSYVEIAVTAEGVETVEVLLAPLLETYSGNESKPRRPAP